MAYRPNGDDAHRQGARGPTIDSNAFAQWLFDSGVLVCADSPFRPSAKNALASYRSYSTIWRVPESDSSIGNNKAVVHGLSSIHR